MVIEQTKAITFKGHTGVNSLKFDFSKYFVINLSSRV